MEIINGNLQTTQTLNPLLGQHFPSQIQYILVTSKVIITNFKVFSQTRYVQKLNNQICIQQKKDNLVKTIKILLKNWTMSDQQMKKKENPTQEALKIRCAHPEGS